MNNSKKIILLSLILCLIAFYRVFSAYFVAEDWEWFSRVENLSISSVYKIFLPVKVGGIETFYFRPIIPFSFWFNLKLFDLNPVPYHLTNFFLHLISALLVYKVALLLLKDKKSAIISFCFFLLSPFSSQAVSMIDARYDLFVTVFILSAWRCYIFFLKEQKIKYLILTYLFFILGFLSKENALIFPLLATLMVYFTKSFKCNWKSLLGLYFLTFSYFLLKVLFISTTIINQLHFGQLYISRVFILWIIFLFFLIVKRKSFSKNIIFTYLLFGVLYLPTAFLPTEERYLYLPSVALIFLSSLVLRKIKRFILITAIAVLFVCLYVLNLRWVKAGEIALSIINQTRDYVSPAISKIYFFGIPDNYQGAFVYRTHLDTALRYNGVKVDLIVTFPQTNGVSKNSVEIIDNKNLSVKSERNFILFKPAITGYTEKLQPVIENNNNKIIFRTRNALKITLKNDNLRNPHSLFLIYNKGFLVPLKYEK